MKLKDNQRQAWTNYVGLIRDTAKALGRSTPFSNLPDGEVRTGKEVGQKPPDSAWWAPAAGAPIQLGVDWSKFVKATNRLGDSLGVISPVASWKKQQTVKALGIAGTALTAVAGAVATVFTFGAAAPAAVTATLAVAGVVGAASSAASTLISKTPEQKQLTLAALQKELSSKARQLQVTPAGQKKKREQLTREIQGLNARISTNTTEMRQAFAERQAAGKEVEAARQQQQMVLFYGALGVSGLVTAGLLITALRSR